jgi:cephalosporin hydroxylase
MNFHKEREEIIRKLGCSEDLARISDQVMPILTELKYPLVFDWLSRPIIQWPQDIVAVQEIIWATQPDLILETGVARGGSLVLSASLLALMDLRDQKMALTSDGPKRRVIGVDIEIRDHNRKAIEEHFLNDYITLISSSSTDEKTIGELTQICSNYKKVLVLLDSNHERSHVDEELRLYSPLVSIGSYLIVFDTVIEKIPGDVYKSDPRPWGKGNSPLNSVDDFLSVNTNYIRDTEYDKKLFMTANPGGFLKKIAV